MKPENLTYGVDDRPPFWTLMGQGLQHVIVNSSGWIILAAVGSTITTSTDQLTSLLRMGMIAVGIGAILQSLKRGPIGSGYLCPPVCGPAYASASTLAGTGFGLPVLFGMTLIAGLFETLFARVLPRVRALFPPEVIGVVMTMVGVAMLPLGIPRLFGVETAAAVAAGTQSIDLEHVLVGLFTFAVMCGCTVWGRGQFRLYPALIGILAGWGVSYWMGLITEHALQDIAQTPWFALPGSPVSAYAFEASMLIPFLIAAMASSLKGVGDLTLCQKVNDADWKRTDLTSVSKGATASGMTTILCGLIGTLGHSTSSSNVGLSVASGVTCRVIGFSMGGLMILFAFIPKLSMLIAELPAPLMGATLLYAACFMILAGIQLLASRLLDARRILMAGVSMSMGLSAGMMPELFQNVPVLLKPIVASSVSFTAAVAVLLNFFFLLGSKRRAVFELQPGKDHYTQIRDALMKFGASVAARKEVVVAAIDALGNAAEALEAGLAQGPVKVALSFDEFNLDLDLSYQGMPLVVPADRPDRAALLRDPDALMSMSAWLMARKVNRVRSHEERGQCHVSLRLEH